MDNHDEDQPLEVVAPSALLSMERASIDGQIATAHAYPRSLEKFKQRALAMACLDPETAESCIYVRPVGKEKNSQGRWVEKFASGPSIRLAEIVAVSYGNIRAYSQIVEQTDRAVRCVGFAHDLESNAAMKSECVEATVNKEGEPYSERQRALMAKVCLKKALRDAIFTVVPRALCKPIMSKAKEVAAGQEKSLDARRKKAQAWVGGLKMDNADARVLAALDVSGWADITAEHLDTLTGLKTAISDGDETYDSAFPAIPQQAKANAPAPTGHQQATQAQKTDVKPETPAKEPQKAPESSETKPEGQPATSTPATPQTSQEAQKQAEATPNQAESEPQPEPDQAFAARSGDTDALASVKLLASKSGISMSQLMTYLGNKKLARDGQKLGDLAEAKLMNITRHLHSWLPEIKALPR